MASTVVDEELTDKTDTAKGRLITSSADTASGTRRFPHPLGIVAALVMVAAGIFTLVGTDWLIGNLSWWHWLVLGATFAVSWFHPATNAIRVALEAVADFAISGLRIPSRIALPIALVSAIIAGGIVTALNGFAAGLATAFGIGLAVAAIQLGPVWILAWGVFLLSFFNVITRYGARFVDRDIIIGETTAMAWQTFALIALLGLGYGVKAGVNPRIDFWWANFSRVKKAWLDFTLHCLCLLPFLFMALRILWNFAGTSLGYKPDRSGQGLPGQWPSGWRVWETWEQASDAGQLPVGPIQTMLFVGFVLWTMQIVAEIIKWGFVMIGRLDYAAGEGEDDEEGFLRVE